MHKGKDDTVGVCGVAGILPGSLSGASILEIVLKMWEKSQTRIFKNRQINSVCCIFCREGKAIVSRPSPYLYKAHMDM